MKTQSIRNGVAAALGMLFVSGAAQATTLILPGVNPLSTSTYNDFNVLSFDLLKSCSVDQPLLCGTNQYPVKSAPGDISDQMIFITGVDGLKASNTSNGWLNADNPFLTPSGQQAISFIMGETEVKQGNGTTTEDNEPVNTFTGDQITQNGVSSWEVTLGTLRSYLKGELVFIFDNNQQMSDLTDWILFWGQARIIDPLGNVKECYEVSSGTGCNPAPDVTLENLDPYNPGLLLPVITGFCVDKTSGATIYSGTNPLIVANSGQCPANSYFVNNNIATSNAEFAAYNSNLTKAVKDVNKYADNYLLSLNIRYAGNNGGFEQGWICSDCTFDDYRVSEPASMALAGLGLIGLAALRRRKQRA